MCAGAALLFSGCAGAQQHLSSDPSPATSRLAAELNGSWDLVHEGNDRDGDARVDRHELHLHVSGNQVHGVWTRSRTWESRDGRPFACNELPNYVVRAQSLLSGRHSEGGIDVVVNNLPLDLNDPCQDSGRPLPLAKKCTLKLDSRRKLSAECGSDRFLLSRRLAPPLPVTLAATRLARLTGVWTWHHRSVDGDGDVRVEDETWHLVQRGDRLQGYYERKVTVLSGDGRPFRCNRQQQYHNVARFNVIGQIDGKVLRIKELSYQTSPGQCETGRRTLDEYRGFLTSGRKQIRLTWDRGAQFLNRRY